MADETADMSDYLEALAGLASRTPLGTGVKSTFASPNLGVGDGTPTQYAGLDLERMGHYNYPHNYETVKPYLVYGKGAKKYNPKAPPGTYAVPSMDRVRPVPNYNNVVYQNPFSR